VCDHWWQRVNRPFAPADENIFILLQPIKILIGRASILQKPNYSCNDTIGPKQKALSRDSSQVHKEKNI
jgi:hypothetical protein